MDGYYESLTTLNQGDVPNHKYCIKIKRCPMNKECCCICFLIFLIYNAYIVTFLYLIQDEDGSL